eukprot:278389_1
MDAFLLIVLVAVVTLCIWYFVFNTSAIFTSKPSNIPFEERDYVEYNDLLDPRIRADPHKFNRHLYDNIISKSEDKAIRSGIIRVCGEKKAFLICKYRPIKDILSNEKVYSSNPFPDERLIAPHAMDDPPHKLIMKYLKKYYSASTVTKQIPIIEKIIQEIIQNFLNRQRINKQMDHGQRTSSLGHDAVDGITTLIVMRTALYMMGLPPKQYRSLKLVHNLITFNDQMVRLLSPQGGIGYQVQFGLK